MFTAAELTTIIEQLTARKERLIDAGMFPRSEGIAELEALIYKAKLARTSLWADASVGKLKLQLESPAMAAALKNI